MQFFYRLYEIWGEGGARCAQGRCSLAETNTVGIVGYSSQTFDGMIYKLILNFNDYEEPLNIISLIYAAFSQKALILADTP